MKIPLPSSIRKALKERARRATAQALHRTGLLSLALRLARRLDRESHLVVLIYHKVVPAEMSEAMQGVRTEHFDDQLAVARALFDVREPQEALAALDRPPERRGKYPLLVTFDDGYVNNLRWAAPLLVKHRIPAIAFVPTGKIGTREFLWPDEVQELVLQTSEHSLRFGGEVYPLDAPAARRDAARAIKARLKTLPYAELQSALAELRAAARVELRHHEGTALLGWDGVEALRAAGLTIGAHSSNHAILARLPDPLLTQDVNQSHATLASRLGIPPRYFAYPNGQPGDFDARAAARVRAAGFERAFTMVRRIASGADDPFMLPRYPPGDEPGALMALDVLRLLVRHIVEERLGRRTQAPVPPPTPLASRPRPAATGEKAAAAVAP